MLLMAQRHESEPETGRIREQPWTKFAAHWRLVGPPLRPCPEDLKRLRSAWIGSLAQGLPRRRIDALLLGVTPELAVFPWADDFHLTAVDASEAMLKAVWPGDSANRRAVQGNWLRMPFAEASFDLVLLDGGGFGPLEELGQELRRVLRPGGRAVMRYFARPPQSEPPEALIQAVADRTLSGFDELKLRLLMAVQGDRGEIGVRLGDAWNCFVRLFPDRASLAVKLGCLPEKVSAIDVYRENDGRYMFRSLEEVAMAFDGFAMAYGPQGHYLLAERCPVFSLAPV
jgi:SAM-dependent methyltransferase